MRQVESFFHLRQPLIILAEYRCILKTVPSRVNQVTHHALLNNIRYIKQIVNLNITLMLRIQHRQLLYRTNSHSVLNNHFAFEVTIRVLYIDCTLY